MRPIHPSSASHAFAVSLLVVSTSALAQDHAAIDVAPSTSLPSCPEGAPLADGSSPPPSACPDGTTEIDGTCVRPSVCPSGTVEDGARCVRTDTVCPQDSTRGADGACVAAVSCPEGASADSNGACIVAAAEPAEASCDRISHVDSERVRFEPRVGLGYATYTIFSDAPEDGAGNELPQPSLDGIAMRLGVGLTHKSLAIDASYARTFGASRSDSSAVVLTLAARCACWRPRYQWRIGLDLGYDFGLDSPLGGMAHVSQVRLWEGLFLAVELRADLTLGGIVLDQGVGALAMSGALSFGWSL